MSITSHLSRTLTAKEIFDLVHQDLLRVEEEFRLESVASEDAVTKIAAHLQQSGGKRMRPTLVLLTSKLFPGRNPAASVQLAAVVELIHTATLIHDDVIDEAETRRGDASTNAIWGNQTSVLAGDWLYMQAFQIALRLRDFHLLDLLISLTQKMVEGELLQARLIGRMVEPHEYVELVDRKTASLFSACARLGAIAGNATEEEERRLGHFAWNLGMAFQLIDDILDFTATEEVLGKPVGSDLREGKMTLPLLAALENATSAERDAVSQVLEDRDYSRVPFARILEIVDSREGILHARQTAERYTAEANLLIAQFPESPAQRALQSIPDFIVQREF
ncbi:MAG: polyprenyl synthetase family protein [Bryobacterales bacterium]|jgi:octaprenyl-diphosphate synthase|nr:polyprenyl synthetase family protein [Bryobacterales bacterium]